MKNKKKKSESFSQPTRLITCANHGDKVVSHGNDGTQPYLMSHLMSNDVGYTPGVSQAGMLGVQQQGCFPIGQKAPVLHGPSSKVGNGNQVQLGEGEGNAEQLFKGGEHGGSDVERYLQVTSSAGHSKDSQLRTQLSLQNHAQLAADVQLACVNTCISGTVMYDLCSASLHCLYRGDKGPS